MANIKDFIKKIGNETVSLEEQQRALAAVEKTIVEAKAKREESIGKNVDLVISALKKIESDLEAKLVELNNTPAKQGVAGPQGEKGRDGRDGVDGYKGQDGKDGVDGEDGKDGSDGISVTDAKVDFDGSLVITLSDGREIDAGTVVSLDVAKNIHSVQTGGTGSTSQAVLDAVAAIQATIATYGTMATQNANAVAITGGTITGVAGLVTSVTGTAPVVSSGGTTPTISMAAATGSVNGYLTSADWTTFNGKGSGTVTSVAATVPSFLSVTGSPITSSGTLALTYSGTALPLANGGTGATSAPYAMANLMGFTSTATAAGTTTLDNTSSYYQVFTGATTQTIVLPVTSTLQTGWTFHICNNSTGALTVNSSGGNLLISVIAGTTVMCTCIGTTLTTAADWEAGYTDFSTLTGTGSVVLSNAPTITGTLGFTGSSTSTASFATSVTTASTSISTAQTTGATTVGGTAQTGAIVLGRSTGSQYIDIANGATASSTTASGTASSITTTVLTVGGTVTGTFVVGMIVTGTNVLADTYITSLGTGTGGAGTYNISRSQTVASTTITGTTQKTISIGTNGVSGSSTVIKLGSSVSGATNTTTVNGILKQQTYTVATLPSASTSGVGARSFVTDALAPTFGATVVTGGAIAVPVYSDGTNWKVG